MKNILILGASGFIGNEIIKALQRRGGCNIMALKHKNPIGISGIHVIHQKLGKLELNKMPFQPDMIIHAARLRTGKFGKLGRRIMAEKGRICNKRLLKQISKYTYQPRLIYLSGSLMYGSIPEYLIHETFPLSPISFAREYVLAEKPFLKEIENKNVNILMLRLPWVIGSGSWFEWNYMNFINKNNKVPLYGDGNNIMTFIDVRNLASTVVKLCQIPHSGLLNLFNQQYLTQKDFAEMMGKILRKEIQWVDIGADSKIDPAVKEAFKSDIQLGSNYKDLQQILQKNMFAVEESVEHFGSALSENK